MFRKKNISVIEETLPEDQVQFKPLFGVRPGVYLGGIYGFILIIILFFVLFYPGLAKPGTLLSLSSEPSGAALRVDDVYMGTTPCEIFIPKGIRRLEMTLPGFALYQQELNVKTRVFGTLFFPRRQSLVGTLGETISPGALLWAASEYGMWSFTGEPTVTYQIPQILSEGAYRSGPAAADPQGYQRMKDILQGSARFTATRGGLRDLIRAEALIDNGGLAASPVSLLRSLEDILVYLSETPGTAYWLAQVLPPETGTLIIDSAWYENQNSSASKLLTLSRSVSSDFGNPLTLGLLRFREISGGTLIQGGAFPHEVKIENFRVAETKVSYPSWDAFVSANPAWGPEFTETLTAQGLVTEDYLMRSEHLDSPAVSGVSWYAAQAYCKWLTTLLPEDLADYEARLPTEAEWEYAVKTADIRDMSEGFWEWCADPYGHNNYLPADKEIIEAIGSPERSVRGASEFSETRGSLFPVSCSPFGSFRPVIAKKALFYE
ncbi:MAG: SUMF1/EgtB/PvdO family nonheme iron enzyme [Treponema sp.]|jgi:hypothetical protein|nr:SUMF1/EgtB/PvdO family nonheme iron enzyme [Treponema sp.]